MDIAGGAEQSRAIVIASAAGSEVISFDFLHSTVLGERLIEFF